MSGFQNPLQMTNNTYQVFPYPGSVHPSITSTWVDATTNGVGFPNSYASTGYQQLNGQIVYPVNMIPSNPGIVPTMSHAHAPHAFQEGLASHNPLWLPGSVVFQGSPNLVSPVTLTSPIVTNPQFLPPNFQNPSEQLMTQAVGMTNQMAPATFGAAQQQQQQLNMSLTQLNASYQQQMLMLQHKQQQEQQQQHQEKDQQHYLNKQQLELMQQQLQKQIEQQQQHQEKEEQHYLKQQQLELMQQQLQKQLEQQQQEHQRLHLVHEQQNQEHQKHLHASKEKSSQDPPGIINPNKDANHNITKTHTESNTHSITTGSIHTESAQAALSGASLGSPDSPSHKILPITLPTSLNPSLQLKSQGSRVESFSSQKTTPYFGQPPSTSQKDVGLNNQLNGANLESKVSQNISVKSSTMLSSVPSPGTPTSTLKTNLPDYYITKPIYQKPKHKHDCLRCNKQVYHMEQCGPIKGVFYHKRCFACVQCGTILNVKNFHHNPNDADDLSVFCTAHKPKEMTRSCDASAVYIKSALTVPKLDKVNEQIRSDRQPSEVLARPWLFQPTASALTTSREQFYYGMQQQAEDAKSNAPQKLQLQEQNHELHHEGLPQQSQRVEQQTESKQMFQQEQHQNHNTQEQSHQPPKQDHHGEVQNDLIQRTILESDKKLLNDFANIKLSQNGDTTTLSSSVMDGTQSNEALADDVFIPRDNGRIPTVPGGDAHFTTSSSSSLTSLLSSSIIHQEITSEDSVGEYIATHFKLDNHKAFLKQNDNHINPGEMQKLSESKLASIQSSRSTSPMQIQTSSRSTDDNESRRSSFSSNLSSRDSVDLGVSAVSYTGRQQPLPSANERADRPSSFYNSTVCDESNANSFSKMDDRNKLDYNLEIKYQNTDMDRFLPKNERMRMDRPSQYS